MATLAIKGHARRGREVIELLEMLGGKVMYQMNVHKENYVYFIDKDKIIRLLKINPLFLEGFTVFALEEFLEKFPYKIGDKVISKYGKLGRISNLIWSKKDNQVRYELETDIDSLYFTNELQPYKEETMDRKYDVEEYLKVWKETEKGLEVVINDKFELKEDNGKFYIIKKQLQYPKTYEECLQILDLGDFDIDITYVTREEYNLHTSFIKLKRCRDAYWEIAGEQMGLGKPWKPDWAKADERKYCIVNIEGNITKWVQKTTNTIFAFPTEEMQDAFKENFDKDLEICKELL